MYCIQCGTTIGEHAKFCSSCGTPKAESQPIQQAPAAETYPSPYETSYPTEGTYPDVWPQQANNSEWGSGVYHAAAPDPAPKRKWTKTIVAACIALVICGIGIFVFFNMFGPSLAVSRAMGNFTEEVTQRVDGSPFGAFGVLVNRLQRGTVTVEFDYESQGWSGTTAVAGTVGFTSDNNNRNYRLWADLSIDAPFGVSLSELQLSAYLNRERIAFGSPQLINEYLGITFASARQDIRPFGDYFGLSRSEMNEFADVMETIESMLNQETEAFATSDYMAPLISLLRSSEESSERAEVFLQGELVRARRVRYVITTDDIANLLREWYDLFEADMREALDGDSNPFMQDLDMDFYLDDLLREMRSLIREFEREIAGSLTLDFYIGDRNRMVRFVGAADFIVDGEREQLEIIADLGIDVNSDWVFSVSYYDTNWRTGERRWETVSLTWSFRSMNDRYVNEINLYENDDWFGTLSSDWNRANGNFTLSYRDDWSNSSIDGNFLMRGRDDFILQFSPPLWNAHLDFTVSTSPDVNIGNISFVNIDRWSDIIMDAVDDFLWDLGF